MGIAGKLVWIVLLLSGLAVFVVGVHLAIGQEPDGTPTSAVIEGRQRTIAFNTGSRGFALLVVGALLMLFCLGASGTVWANKNAPAADRGRLAPPPPVVLETQITPTGRPTQASPTVTIVIVAPRVSQASSDKTTPPSRHSLPCDGSWATSLGSTQGVTKTPTQFLQDVRTELQDPSLRIIETSTECASITPGIYQVVGGVYPTADGVLAECARRGLTSRNWCFAEILTENPADRAQRKYPD